MPNVYNEFQLTDNNHLQYYYNNDKNQHWRTHPFDVAHMQFGGNYKHESFNDSIESTARILSDRHSEFSIFLSGGLDSEVACRTFSSLNIKYEPIILKFENELNVEDVFNATNLCNTLGIKPSIIDINPVKFFESGDWKRISIKYQAYTFYQQLLIYVAEQLACPMITIDEIELSMQDDRSWAFSKKEDQDACWHRFVELTRIPAYNNFYTYFPSTIISFLKSPTVMKLIDNKIFGKLNWTSSKHLIYSELTNWDMNVRPKKTGMEHMMHIWTYVENECISILDSRPNTFYIGIDKLNDSIRTGKSITCSTT